MSLVTFEELRQISRRQSRRAVPPSRHQIQMKRCEARSKVLPLDQLRGLPNADEYDRSGIYFLWRGPALVYIGQSKYVATRIGQHRESQKQFTRATVERAHEAWIRHNESEYVLKYSPSLNMTRLV